MYGLLQNSGGNSQDFQLLKVGGASGENPAVIAEGTERTYTTIIPPPPIPLLADDLCESG
jgi:hypothetical protein